MGRVYKLTYFDARGRAETIRLIFAEWDWKYEDIRVTNEEWATLKPKMPCGTLPVVEYKEKMLSQSTAIARFVAREAGLAGRTNYDQATVESLVDLIDSLREFFMKILGCKDEAKKAELKKEFPEKVKGVLVSLERQHKSNKDATEWLHGKYGQVSWADLHLFVVSEQIKELEPDAFKAFPTLEQLLVRVSELPNVAAYMENRKKTTW